MEELCDEFKEQADGLLQDTIYPAIKEDFNYILNEDDCIDDADILNVLNYIIRELSKEAKVLEESIRN